MASYLLRYTDISETMTSYRPRYTENLTTCIKGMNYEMINNRKKWQAKSILNHTRPLSIIFPKVIGERRRKGSTVVDENSIKVLSDAAAAAPRGLVVILSLLLCPAVLTYCIIIPSFVKILLRYHFTSM